MLLIANQTPSTLWNAHTHSHHQLSFIQVQIAPLPSTTHITTHLQDHIPLQRFHKTHTDTIHLTTSTLTSKSSHSHQQYKLTYWTTQTTTINRPKPYTPTQHNRSRPKTPTHYPLHSQYSHCITSHTTTIPWADQPAIMNLLIQPINTEKTRFVPNTIYPPPHPPPHLPRHRLLLHIFSLSHTILLNTDPLTSILHNILRPFVHVYIYTSSKMTFSSLLYDYWLSCSYCK